MTHRGSATAGTGGLPTASITISIMGGRAMKRMMHLLLPLCVLAGAVLAQQQSQAPKPGPEHKRLGFFVGKWTFEGEAKASPLGPAGKITSTENGEWFPGNFFVVARSSGTSPEGHTQEMSIMGYSTAEKCYTYDGYSSMGYHSSSKGTVQGAVWTWLWEEKIEGKPMKGRVTVTEVSPASYMFKSEISTDGKTWSVGAEGKATKVK